VVVVVVDCGAFEHPAVVRACGVLAF
jgi:hypothetical protein